MQPSSSATSGGHTCTGIHNCGPDPENDYLSWTCVLGKTCGFSYGECNPCPYIAGGSGSPTSIAEGSSPTFSSEGSSPTVGSGSGSSPTTSGSAGSTPSPGGGSTKNSASGLREGGFGVGWLAAVSLGGVLGVAVYYI